jgi:hypothetical protein
MAGSGVFLSHVVVLLTCTFHTKSFLTNAAALCIELLPGQLVLANPTMQAVARHIIHIRHFYCSDMSPKMPYT